MDFGVILVEFEGGEDMMISFSGLMEFFECHPVFVFVMLGVIGGLVAVVIFRLWFQLRRERSQQIINDIERWREELHKNFHSGDEAWKKAIIKALKADNKVRNGKISRIFNEPEWYCSEFDHDIAEYYFTYVAELHDGYVFKQEEKQAKLRNREEFKAYYEQLRTRVEDLPLAMFCGGKTVGLYVLRSKVSIELLDDFGYSEFDFGRFCRRLQKYEADRKNLVEEFGYSYDSAYYADLRQIAMAKLEEFEDCRVKRKSKKRAKFERECENRNLPEWLRNQIVINFR